MRLFSLSIAFLALMTVAYVSFKTPSSAAVYSDDMHVASAASARR